MTSATKPSPRVSRPKPRTSSAKRQPFVFKALRRGLVEFLLGSKDERHTVCARKLTLPDIEPEDLAIPRSVVNNRRTPIRRSEIKREAVEVEL